MSRIKAADLHKLLSEHSQEKITFQKIVEELNNIAGSFDNTKSFDEYADEYINIVTLDKNTYKGDVQTAYVCGMSKMIEILNK